MEERAGDEARIRSLLGELKEKVVGFPRLAGSGGCEWGHIEGVIEELKAIVDEMEKILRRSAAACPEDVLKSCAALPEVSYWLEFYMDGVCPALRQRDFVRAGPQAGYGRAERGISPRLAPMEPIW